MNKWTKICLAALLSGSAGASATLTVAPMLAQAAIEAGSYTVQLAPYYNGNISKNMQSNMNATAQLDVKNGVETVTISLVNATSYKDVKDANGHDIPLKRHADGTATMTVSGTNIVKNGVYAKFHIVVPEINYDHDYDIHLKFDAASLISTAAPTTQCILSGTAINRVAKKDTITVKGVQKGDTVRLYNGGAVLKTMTATSKTATFTVKQLGKKAGEIMVTAQATGEQESAKVRIAFKAELVSAKIAATNVTITNKKGKAHDKVVVKELKKGDVVKFYDSLGNGLGRVTATTSTATFKPKSLKATGSKLIMTRTEVGKNPSAKVAKRYNAEK
ncbi:NEAT domain-containing protein [Kurthia huakuii]|uniref:NEAT domain-containing protein n=1 Tax=Kurthia huakuii TaxID=1421019 RepID=UPI000496813C|nr:NEAT domain-containing protein [Kurthia huakuii]MBM7697818.1 hypothetical protein [Kurthia huakuii]